jgi:two-component system sensor histidine kinase PilS (NtrC family)
VQAARRDPLDLRDVVRAAVALAGTHPDRGADVGITLALPETPASLFGDEDLLHRTVFNLVLNAVQATGDRGHVSVTVRRVVGAEQPTGLAVPGASWAIEVQDDGPGIPADIQDRLFEPFATTKPGGSGLGLAVVHRAVEAHRGVTLVDSDATGTRFTVYLPTEDESSGAAS